VKNLKIELKMYIQLQILHFVQNDYWKLSLDYGYYINQQYKYTEPYLQPFPATSLPYGINRQTKNPVNNLTGF